MSDHLELIGQIIEERQRDASAVTESKLQSVIDDLGRKHQEISLEIDAAGVVLMGYADERLEEAHSRNDAYHAKQLQELVECRKGIEVALGEVTTKLAEVKDGEKGETGDPGIAGVDGLDRPLLEPVALVAQKDYDKNTLGTYAGGLWISTKKACGNPDDDPHAWSCILDAMSSMEIDLQEDHTFKLSVKMGTGKLIEDTFKIPYPEHKGIWEEGEYEKGQIVTKGSAFFQAITDTDKAPPGNGWQQILVAPRGKQGPAGKSIQGPQGKPGRNGKDAVLPEGFIDELLELASNNKAFDDGRSDAYSITSFRGYFSSGESYAAGDVVSWDGAIYLCVSGGQFQSIATSQGAFELMLGVPKIGHVAYMLWQGAWEQKTYAGGHTVRDNGWTMVATTQTSQRAAPQPIGSPFWVSQLDASPAWQAETSTPTSEIYYGQRYTFGQSGYATDVRLWIDEADPTKTYAVYVVADPDGSHVVETILNESSFTTTGWRELPISTSIIREGSVFEVVVRKFDRTGSTDNNANYSYDTPNNPAIPPAGGIVHANTLIEELRVSYLDDDGGDQSTFFATMQPGDKIAGAGIGWTITTVTDVPGGNYYAFGVTPEVQGLDGVGVFTFTTFTDQAIAYPKITDHYASNAQVTGFFSSDGPTASVEDEAAYGIDIQVQDAYIPTDWEVVSESTQIGTDNTRLSASQRDWVDASSNGYNTRVNRLTTTDNAWNEISRDYIPEGTGYKASIIIDGKRRDSVGYYSAEWVLLAWNDNGVDYDSKTLGELGVSQCEFRADTDGDYIVFEVNGQNNKVWDFEITTFVRELND